MFLAGFAGSRDLPAEQVSVSLHRGLNGIAFGAIARALRRVETRNLRAGLPMIVQGFCRGPLSDPCRAMF